MNPGADDAPESEESSSDSSAEEDEAAAAANQQLVADIDAIVKTPRPNAQVLDWLRLCYEEGQTRIEMPWYTQQKI